MSKFRLISIVLSIMLIYSLSPSNIFAKGDIRDVTTGINVTSLPLEGYTNFLCFLNKKEINSWSDYYLCDKNKKDLHVLSYEYDDRYSFNENYEGTQVAGHPVKISILISSKGIIEQINIITDPDAPMYFKRQAHNLYLRVRARYGADEWECISFKQEDDETILGKEYINKLCRKVLDKKQIITKTELYLKQGNEPKPQLVSKSELIIGRLDK